MKNRGHITLLALVFTGIFMVVSTALVSSTFAYGRLTRTTVAAAQALALAEGAIDSAVDKLNQNSSYSGETNVVLGEGTFTVAVTPIDSATRRITATGYVPSAAAPISTRVVKADVGISNDVIAFHYGVQTAEGGLHLKNSSSVRGNVFSNGPVTGENSNIVRGDVVSAGPTGLIDGLHATSSGYARTIRNARLDKNAYYQTISNTTVGGTSYPGSPNQATSTLPISDARIEEWKADAAAGGTHSGSCPYTITSSVTLGPRKIPCNLTISGSPTVTLAGPIWIDGNLTIENSARLRVSSSLSGKSVTVIADDPDNPTTGGKIILQNSATVTESGSGSYVLFISQNKSAKQGGSGTAIEVQNSVSGDFLAYAGHGKIVLKNSISLKEVSAYRLEAENSAEIVYSSGLANVNFSSGPGGSWGFVPGTYTIAK